MTMVHANQKLFEQARACLKPESIFLFDIIDPGMVLPPDAIWSAFHISPASARNTILISQTALGLRCTLKGPDSASSVTPLTSILRLTCSLKFAR